MVALLKRNYIYYLLFLPVYILAGVAGSIVPFMVAISGTGWFILKKRYELVALTFIVTLILANSKLALFTGYDPVRALFVLIMAALSFLIMRREGYLERRVIYFLPFFIVAFLVSVLFSPQFASSVLSTISYLLLVISVFVFISRILEHDYLHFYDHLVVLIIVTMVISLIGYIIYPSYFIESGRLRGIFGNPNVLALFCVIVYPFLDYYDPQKGNISKLGILIGKGLLILSLFLSGSRTGYTSFVIYLLLSIFLFKGMSGRTVAVLVGVAALFALFQIETVVNIFPGLKDIIRPESLQSASGRLLAWDVAIEEVFRQPWLGRGYEYSWYYMGHFANVHDLISVYWNGVWNSYLAFLMDVGIIGLATYCFFIFGLVKSSPRSLLLIPFLGVVMFSAIFESWMTSSLNAVTALFLIFFIINAEYEGRY